MTCKECRYYNKCMERSREYPCKDFKKLQAETHYAKDIVDECECK